MLILLVTLHALHLRIAADLGGRSGLGVSLLVLLGIAVLVVPIAILMSSNRGRWPARVAAMLRRECLRPVRRLELLLSLSSQSGSM